MKTQQEIKPFRERLRSWRNGKNWTQRQAADHLRAALSTYQHWEQGHQMPKGPALHYIETAIGNGKA